MVLVAIVHDAELNPALHFKTIIQNVELDW